MQPIADRRLAGLGKQRLHIEKERSLERPARLNSWRTVLAFILNASPATCTTARFGIVSPPVMSAMPTAPSLPTRPISAVTPSRIVYTSETMQDLGNKDDRGGPPIRR